MTPFESTMITSRTEVQMLLPSPTQLSRFAIVKPAAPAPEMTTLMSDILFPTTFNALIRPARTTIAVPCWSSWKTGMPISSNLSSIMNARGAEMSSRLMPPKPGAIFLTIVMISSTFCVARTIGYASTPPNSLKRIALPSMTGRAASGPILPRPRTAEPSETTATLFALQVRSYAFVLSLAISRQTAATPGVYAVERSSFVARATFEVTEIFPLYFALCSIAFWANCMMLEGR